MSQTVRTRFAPSPTGMLHIGGARTALFCQLYAHHHGGEYLVRIEDTDKERSTQENIDIIKESLAWLGLSPDKEYILQSTLQPRHNDVIKQLVEKQAAYEKDGAIWLTVPNKETGVTTWVDLVQGRIDYPHDSPSMKDFVIQRSDGSPTYNLTNVVDDHDMEISHVIRGDDHINNTPKQILIYQAMGWNMPQFAHIPLIHGPDGKKMSKRHGATGVFDYKNEGYLPEALINYLMRLGWSWGDHEIFSKKEAVEHFDVKDVNKGASIFDFAKLEWVNAHYLKQTVASDLIPHLRPLYAEKGIDLSAQSEEWLKAGLFDLTARAKTLNDLADAALFYVNPLPFVLSEKNQEILDNGGSDVLKNILETFSHVKNWDSNTLHDVLNKFVEESGLKFKEVGMPLRIALMGATGGPGLAEVMAVLGEEETLRRINSVL